jgi:hypothetical protein
MKYLFLILFIHCTGGVVVELKDAEPSKTKEDKFWFEFLVSHSGYSIDSRTFFYRENEDQALENDDDRQTTRFLLFSLGGYKYYRMKRK